MSATLSLTELERFDPRSPAGRRQRRFLCPLCGGEKPSDSAHRSLCVNSETGAWVCHRCGAKGLLKEHWDERPISARDRSRSALLSAFAVGSAKQGGEAVAGRYEWQAAWRAAAGVAGSSGEEYLERRGIPATLAQQFGLRFARRWYQRPAVLFPIHDRQGGLIAVSGRFIDGREDPKTQTAGPKSQGVFSALLTADAPIVAITEGPLDALSLALCGVPALALIGTSWPAWLPSRLAFRHVLIATDADPSGDAAARRLEQELAPLGTQLFRLRPRGAKDWNELLDLRGVEETRSRLCGFAAATPDEVRLVESSRLSQAGRDKAARFVKSLVRNPQLRHGSAARE